jgi:hypothetical protein
MPLIIPKHAAYFQYTGLNKLEFDRLPAAGAGAGPWADTDQGVADGSVPDHCK